MYIEIMQIKGCLVKVLLDQIVWNIKILVKILIAVKIKLNMRFLSCYKYIGTTIGFDCNLRTNVLEK